MKLFKGKNKMKETKEAKETREHKAREHGILPRGILFFDNGTTGTIGWIYGGGASYADYDMIEAPVKKRASFHKEPRSTTVIDVEKLKGTIRGWMEQASLIPKDIIAYRERPMINPKRWQASMSASRADEAETIMLEQLGIEYHYVDSKAWQRHVLPSSGKAGTTSDMLKAESMDIGLKEFKDHPGIVQCIRKHGDADGILGAYVFNIIEHNILSDIPNWKLQLDSDGNGRFIDPDEEAEGAANNDA